MQKNALEKVMKACLFVQTMRILFMNLGGVHNFN